MERRTPQQNRRLADLFLHRAKRKRKKRRQRRTLRTSSRSLRRRARRRPRQLHALSVGFVGDFPFRAVFPSVVAWPVMLGIIAGMDLKDSPRVWCAHRRLWQWHVPGLFFFLAQCSLWLQTGPDALHHVRHGPEGYVRSWLVSLYGPLYLAVTCSIWFWPKEYSTSSFGEKTSGVAVFSASWFDSGNIFVPVYGFWGVLSPYSAQCLVRQLQFLYQVFHRCSSWTRFSCPLCAMTGPRVPDSSETCGGPTGADLRDAMVVRWTTPSRSHSSLLSCPLLCNDRCWSRRADHCGGLRSCISWCDGKAF